MRMIETHKLPGLNSVLRVEPQLDLKPGEPCSSYTIFAKGFTEWTKILQIKFHEGELKEDGPKGVSNESLLAILIDRFQLGSQSRETSLVVTYLQQAMMWSRAAASGEFQTRKE